MRKPAMHLVKRLVTIARVKLKASTPRWPALLFNKKKSRDRFVYVSPETLEFCVLSDLIILFFC